jgi:glycosyltransferase involved in cell wall biosynthesis
MTFRGVVMLSPSEFPGFSGDTASDLDLARGFRDRGLGVVLVCPWHYLHREFDEGMAREGIEVVRIPLSPPRLREVKSRPFPVVVAKLAAFYVTQLAAVLYVLCRRGTKDLWIVRYSILVGVFPVIRRLTRLHAVCDIREIPTSIPRSCSVPPVLDVLGRGFANLFLSFFEAFRVLAPYYRTELCRLGIPHDRITVSRPGLDPRRSPPVIPLLEIPPASFAFVGSLEDWQGIDDLLFAFARIARVHREARLFIVGKGSMLDSLQRKARDLGLAKRTVFIPGVPREQLWKEIFPRFRILVIPRPPSISSSLVPMKLVEGITAGKVIVTTPIAGLEDVLKLCAVVTPASADALAREMNRVMEDESLQVALHEAALKAARLFDLGRVISDILSLFDEDAGSRCWS